MVQRSPGRKTKTQTDQTERQAGRQIRQAVRQAGRQADRQTERQAVSQTLIFKCSLLIDFVQVANEIWYPRRTTIALLKFQI